MNVELCKLNKISMLRRSLIFYPIHIVHSTRNNDRFWTHLYSKWFKNNTGSGALYNLNSPSDWHPPWTHFQKGYLESKTGICPLTQRYSLGSLNTPLNHPKFSPFLKCSPVCTTICLCMLKGLWEMVFFKACHDAPEHREWRLIIHGCRWLNNGIVSYTEAFVWIFQYRFIFDFI